MKSRLALVVVVLFAGVLLWSPAEGASAQERRQADEPDLWREYPLEQRAQPRPSPSPVTASSAPPPAPRAVPGPAVVPAPETDASRGGFSSGLLVGVALLGLSALGAYGLVRSPALTLPMSWPTTVVVLLGLAVLLGFCLSALLTTS